MSYVACPQILSDPIAEVVLSAKGDDSKRSSSQVVASTAGGARHALLLDAVERFFILGLYCWMVGRMLPDVAAGLRLGDMLLIMGEGLVVIFFLIRIRTTEISRSPWEWLIASMATCAPLLVGPGGEQPLLPATATTVMLIGMALQFSAKLTLARSVGMVPAHRGLHTTGPYQFVRHPMYCGYLLMHIGFLALNPTWWNLSAYAVCNSLQVLRILAEERFLSRDPAYRNYQSQVAYRLLPGIF
jgi:protein-S-isoprenylcysteine O-methyltransferase Ste14